MTISEREFFTRRRFLSVRIAVCLAMFVGCLGLGMLTTWRLGPWAAVGWWVGGGVWFTNLSREFRT